MNVSQTNWGLAASRWWRSATILCGSTGLGGAEAELPSSFVFGQSSKYKASRRQRLAQASRLALGGAAPPVKRSATPLFGLPVRVAVHRTLHSSARCAGSVADRSMPWHTSSEQGSRAFQRRAVKSLQKTRSRDCGGCISVYR